jgi:hypothetical protein
MNKYIAFLIFSFFSTFTNAQSSLSAQEMELAFHCDVMTNAYETRHRLQGHDVFYKGIKKALDTPNSFSYPFDSLKWISKVYPDDRSFRIISWEVKGDPNETKYYGFLQKADGTVFELTDQFKQAEGLEEEVNHESWYGAIYYHVMEVNPDKGEKCYLLFGQHKWSALEHKKLIDVLFFTKSGQPYFGKKLFKVPGKNEIDKYYNRLVFTYASDARMTLNYNPGLKMIMHDHLVPKLSRIEEQAKTMVPDGSYMAWEWDNKNHWVLIEKLANQVMDSAPRPTPILDQQKGKGIFGNPKKN